MTEAIDQQGVRRSVTARWIARMMSIFSIVAGISMIGLYLPIGSWQHLAMSAAFWISLPVAIYAGRLARKNHSPVAARLIVGLPLALTFVASLLWSGLTVALAITAMNATAVIVTLIIRPGRRGLPWGLSVLVGLVVLATASVPLPWQRLDVGGHPATLAISWLLIIIAIGLVLWRSVLAYRRLVAIRTRLTVTSIVLVFIVATVVSVSSILLQVKIGQQQAFDLLETTVDLKSQSVNSWIDQLRFALESLVVEDYEVQRAQVVLSRSPTEESRGSSAQALRARFRSLIERTGWLTEIFLINTDGEVVLSTNQDLEGRNVSGRRYVQEGVKAFYLEPPRYDPMVDGVTIVFARPLQLGGSIYGIVAARTDMTQLNEIIASGQLGETGTIDLVSADHMLLAAPALTGGYLPVRSDGIEAALQQPTNIEHSIYTSHTGLRVSGAYAWLPGLRVVLLAEQDQTEVRSGAVITSLISGGVGLLATLVAVIFALAFSNSISGPLSRLAAVATRVAASPVASLDLDITAAVERDDEIGAVARAFNGMTAQLRDLIGGLERRVQERTRGLQAVAEVSRATTSVLDPDQLLPQVVDLAQQNFGLYYVGLFLLDERGDNAVLRAGTGTAGAEMLARHWQLPVGGESMIGRCVATGEAVIQQQAGDEAVRFETPWLPETRSELALPLRYGGRVTGAMTVQSTASSAFDETDIAVLQNLADQVAVAVENARLFAETQSALDRVRRVQRRYERRQWSEYLGARTVSGYELTGSVMRPLGRDLLPEVQEALTSDVPLPGETMNGDHQILIPITQADQVIGVVGVQRDAAWSDEDAGLVHALAEQLSLAAENQRLLDVTQRREAAERLTREVTAEMRQTLDVDQVLQSAVRRISEALDAAEVSIRLTVGDADLASAQPGGGGVDADPVDAQQQES